MRILILNTYEYPPNLNADSSFTLTRSLIQSISRYRDDIFFYWVLPQVEGVSPLHYWKFEDEWDAPRLKKIFVPLYSNRDINEWMFSEELFQQIDPWVGKYGTFDLVLSNNAGKAGKMCELLGKLSGGTHLELLCGIIIRRVCTTRNARMRIMRIWHGTPYRTRL